MKRVRNQPVAPVVDNGIATFLEASFRAEKMTRMKPQQAYEIHASIQALDEFLRAKIEDLLQSGATRFLPDAVTSTDCDNLQLIIMFSENMLASDPAFFTTTLPSNCTNWSLGMLTWLMIGKAVIIRNQLYRLHPSYRVYRLVRDHPARDNSCARAFLDSSAALRKTTAPTRTKHRRLPSTLRDTELGGLAAHCPFQLKYMIAMTDSEYLVACSAVNTAKPILSLSLSELMEQIRAFHCAFAENMRYHADIRTALTLLEMRAFVFASMPWDETTMDIPPMDVAHNIVAAGQEGQDPQTYALTRNYEPASSSSRRIRTASHRFVFEMYKFFTTCSLHLRLYNLYQHVDVGVLDLPMADRDPPTDETDDELSPWQTYLEELRMCEGTLDAEVSRDGMSNMLRLFQTRPCEKDMYRKALKLGHGNFPITQVWYEFRPGEAVSRCLLSFSPDWIGKNRSAVDKVPNPAYAWQTMRGGSTPTGSATPASRILETHTKVRSVVDCKLGGSLINSYLPPGSESKIVWEKLFFVVADDLIVNPAEKLNPTGSNIMPKVVFMMNDFYLYTRVEHAGRHIPYFVSMPDMQTAIFAWIYTVHEYCNDTLFKAHSIRHLTHRIFARGDSKYFKSRVDKDAVCVKKRNAPPVVLAPIT